MRLIVLQMVSDKKRSPVWNHFSPAEDESLAISKHYGKQVPCGGKSKKPYNTTNLVNHRKTTANCLKSTIKIKLSSKNEMMLNERVEKSKARNKFHLNRAAR